MVMKRRDVTYEIGQRVWVGFLETEWLGTIVEYTGDGHWWVNCQGEEWLVDRSRLTPAD